MAWPCFLLEPTNRYQKFTRRYAFNDEAARPCPHGTYHNASEILCVEAIDGDYPPTYCDGAIPSDLRTSLSFPTQCACGYVFTVGDHAQLGHTVLFRDPTGNCYPKHQVPVGGMWHAWWARDFPDLSHANDPLGPLHVMLPGGLWWNVDGPCKKGEYWTRRGTPPMVTAEPSILVPGYHGWLRDGALTDHLG